MLLSMLSMSVTTIPPECARKKLSGSDADADPDADTDDRGSRPPPELDLLFLLFDFLLLILFLTETAVAAAVVEEEEVDDDEEDTELVDVFPPSLPTPTPINAKVFKSSQPIAPEPTTKTRIFASSRASALP